MSRLTQALNAGLRAVGRPLAILAVFWAARGYGAEFIEQTVAVPVEIERSGAATERQAIQVVIVREAGKGRRPFLVLHHGRGTDPAERSALGLANYPANSRYFAAHGFVVLMPTRVGYGVTGGPDLENTGDCSSKRYADGVAVAVSETRALLAYAARLPYVDAAHGIVVGESFGGLVAVAMASTDTPGLLAAVSIEGGDGGDLRRHADQPCRPDQLGETFASYGRANRLPTLWMYSANDRVWGPIYPQRWFAAFTRAGGRGQFVALPADKNNGHFIFNRNPQAWHPAFENFLAGLPLPAAPQQESTH
jgi:dienelactone hydrolase